MSKYYEMAKAYYPTKWNIAMLRNLVAKGRLTEEEFAEITGENYA